MVRRLVLDFILTDCVGYSLFHILTVAQSIIQISTDYIDLAKRIAFRDLNANDRFVWKYRESLQYLKK